MELFLITIAWLFGILSGLYFKISIVFFVLFCVVFIRIRRANTNIKKVCIKSYIIIFILSYSISYFQIICLEKSFNEKYKNIKGEINVVGTIVSNPSNKQYKTNYTLKVESINGDKLYKNTKIILSVKKDKNEKYYSYGNKICFIGEFKEANLQRNYGGFDYKQYLKTKNIYGTITTKSSNVKVIKNNNTNIVLKFINEVALKIEEKANKLLNETEASLLIGLLIGNKENLDDNIEETFRKSNLSHMLAVSGSHVSYVILAIGFIITKSKISKKKGKIITIIFLIFFMILTGQTPSVTRACIMSIYMIVSSLFYKRVNILSSMSISLWILLIMNPYCIFDIGLQLSYGGTIGIVILYKRLKKVFEKNNINEKEGIKRYIELLKTKIKEMVLVTISANIILFPIMIYHFNTLSLTFVISNLLASPIMGILVILGFVTIIISFVFMPIANLLSIILKIFLNLFLQIANITGNMPLSQIYIITPSLIYIILYYLCVFILIYYKEKKEIVIKSINNIQIKVKSKINREVDVKIDREIKEKIKLKKRKIVAIFIIIIILTNSIYKQIPTNLKIHFIDVGQGDSMLIITPNKKNILIDGGGSKDKENFDVGESTLMPYLLDRKINKLDYIMISHFDADHVGGILTILKKMKVEKVIISQQGEDSENYQEFKKIIKEKKIEVLVVKKGDNLLVEKELVLRILWPKQEQMKENILNNNSIVAKLEYKTFSMLLTGDIEEIAEKEILEEYKNSDILKSVVLKVAHHGSKSSSVQSFLDKVKPKIALIGVGENNTFGHPNNGVLDRLKKIGTSICRTDIDGEISIIVDNIGKIKVKKFVK